MASKFFHVHHEFRAGKAQQWWETAQTAMAPRGGWDEAVAKNYKRVSTTTPFALLGQKDLPFVSGKSARASLQRNFKSSSMVPTA